MGGPGGPGLAGLDAVNGLLPMSTIHASLLLQGWRDKHTAGPRQTNLSNQLWEPDQRFRVRPGR